MVTISGGRLRGETGEDGLTAYRGIPYAQAARFAPPGPAPSWTGVRDATRHGPMSPQPPFRPGSVTGEPPPAPQDEDCLNLTVLTPGTEGPKKPVLVWIHGGAYVTGSASLEFYQGRRLAAEGDVVFVGINYRLGALGYLKLDGVSPGNLGLLDQIAALRWVRENIAAFGGDPGAVTVLGQSAGAHSIACLMAVPETRGLFHRAIVQSAPLGLKIAGQRASDRIARFFTAALRKDPRTATVDEILAAQGKAIARASGPGGIYSVPPFCPAAETDPLPSAARWLDDAASRAREVDVLIGTTRDEMNTYLNNRPELAPLEAIGPVRKGFDAVKTGITKFVFETPSRRFADKLATAGGKVFGYRFDWSAPESGFGACHCIELPFLLGDRASWAPAPMLAGTDWDELAELGHRLRGAWLSFARTGFPGWEAHSAGAPLGFRWRDSGPNQRVSPAAGRR
ncbi:carboxylesterase/lipase family protein [Amycolatopsis acidicola]|uniref:carboxylesterase/lipase family protein n=1 Tax=Amycolatopsis acidicola TaxID=2596893 RepID=UPI001FB75F63|nr:carboxylesterase family protein [Amycolatopsis acidicola]